MANICTTTIYVEGKEESIDKLDNLFNETLDIMNDSFSNRGNNWIGKLLIKSNIDPDKYDTRRAFICDYFVDSDYSFYTMMESAWDEKMEAMNAVFHSVDPDLKSVYFAEEAAMDYYVSNDTDNKYFGDYYVDIVEDDFHTAMKTGNLKRVQEIFGLGNNFFTARELKAALAELLNDPFTKLDKMIDQIDDCEVWDPEETGLYISIHKIEKVEK